MATTQYNRNNIKIHLLIFSLLVCIAVGLKCIDIKSSWQQAGLINLSMGFLLLISYVVAQILKHGKLPLISGYILTGIVAGPYVTGFLSFDMVKQLRLIDDLALSFIALTAGGALHLAFLKQRFSAFFFNIFFQSVLLIGITMAFVIYFGPFFKIFQSVSGAHLIVMALLLGVLSVARSPSSAIAIITECKASGKFTVTVLGVTVVVDVVIIVLFTIALTLSQVLVSGNEMTDLSALTGLSMEILTSLIIGVIAGKGIAFYIERIGSDLILFLLFIAFGIGKTSLWLSGFVEHQFGVFLHLEPLLICMSAGFFIQNFTSTGMDFMETLERMSLPIFVLFFTLAGASLNLHSLLICWPVALCLVGVRLLGLFGGAWVAGGIIRDPKQHSRLGGMAYITQAGVAIGLAQLAQREFPEIGNYLNTLVLAVIAINQVIGPVTLKWALDRVGETNN